jgi:hypothetical protein
MQSDADPATAAPTPRRVALATFMALAAVVGDARAQMGGGHHGGGQARPADDAKDKPRTDCPKGEPTLPRDLMAVFAARLRDTPGDLAIQPAQARAFQDFLASALEVGQHDERWIQRTLAEGVGTVSAAEPLHAFIGAEAADADDRQQALQDLRARHAALQAMLDERQRAALSALFTATRSDLRADLRG